MFGWIGRIGEVSVLYREPKLLKDVAATIFPRVDRRFSALP